MRRAVRGVIVGFLALSAVTLAAATVAPPLRVLATGTGAFVDVNAMVTDLAAADVVFLGEPKGPAAGLAAAEHAIVRDLAARRGTSLVLALGMFGRDVQEPFDHFAMGHIGVDELAASTGPWSDDQAAHQPVIDFVGQLGRVIVAANAPARLLAEVAASGLGAVDAHSAEQALFARERRCDASGPEFARFAASPGADGAPPPPHAFEAACLEDETIGESLARAASMGTGAGARSFVVSVNDAARSDYRAGAVARTHRRLPSARLAVVSFEVTDRPDDAAVPSDAAARADYLVYVQQP